MTPPILTCTDGSSYASSIYQHAAWAAQRLLAPIELLHVVEQHREQAPIWDLSGAIGIDARLELTEELTRLEETQARVSRLKGKAILEEARQLLLKSGVKEISTTQKNGTLVETLVDLEPHAELVVVGKRGEHAGGTHSPLGQNLENLVRMSVRPVLVASRAFQPITRCLLAFDDSPSARKAVDYLASSTLFRGLDCHLLMVGYADPAHETALEQAREKLAASGLQVRATLTAGQPATVIAEEVKQSGIHLLIIGAYGHSKIREFFVGSTTTKLVRACSIPALMFR